MGSWCSRLVYCEIKAFLSSHCGEWYTGIGGGGCCTENTWIWFDSLCFSQAEIDGIKKKAEEQTKVKNIRKLQNSASSDDKHQNHLHHDHHHHHKQHHEHLMIPDTGLRGTSECFCSKPCPSTSAGSSQGFQTHSWRKRRSRMILSWLKSIGGFNIQSTKLSWGFQETMTMTNNFHPGALHN